MPLKYINNVPTYIKNIFLCKDLLSTKVPKEAAKNHYGKSNNHSKPQIQRMVSILILDSILRPLKYDDSNDLL